METERKAIEQLVILAGGKGTRLRSALGDLPKPLAEVGGKPVLQHQIESAARHGFRELVLLTSYRADTIEARFGSGETFGIGIRYIVDENPLGTAGAVLAALNGLQERFVVLYGDVMHDVDLKRFCSRHLDAGADGTLFVHPNDHPYDSDLIEMDAEGWIRAFHGYPHAEGTWHRNMVNAGLYVIERRTLERWGRPGVKEDFGKHVFPRMAAGGARLAAYVSREYIKDMGTPERLEKVNRAWDAGRISGRNMANPSPAIFLDRDGTLVRNVPWLKRAEDVELIDGAGEAVRAINESGFLAVLVTNQPVIARGECSPAEMERIHGRMEHLLAGSGAYLDALYYCPHHPDSGYPGEVRDLKGPCDCRKPAGGMLRRAAREHNIDLAGSWLVGDTTADMETAARAGLRSVLVRTGEGGEDGRYDAAPACVAADIGDAVRTILSWK